MTIDLIKYEKIRFSDKTTNRVVAKYGYKVGEFLAVSHVIPERNKYIPDQWRVYRFVDGLPAIKTTFETPQDAINFAEWLDSIYHDYFHIWLEYPQADLFRWTYLTIDNGEEYWHYLKELESKRNIKWIGYN